MLLLSAQNYQTAKGHSISRPQKDQEILKLFMLLIILLEVLE